MSITNIQTHSIGSGQSTAPGPKTPGKISKSFSELLAVENQKASAPSLAESAKSALSGLSLEWQRVETKTKKTISKLPHETRSLVELQLSVYRLGLQTQVLTKAGETFSSTVRRVQSMGTN